MKAAKVNDEHEIRIQVLRPGDYYEPEVLGKDQVLLRKVEGPREMLTYAQALAVIENSPLRFTLSWDELKSETR